MSAGAEVRIGDIGDIGNDESFDVALLNVTIDIHESSPLRSNVSTFLDRRRDPDGEQAERRHGSGRVRADWRGWLGRPRVRSWTRQRSTRLARWLASMFPTAPDWSENAC